MVQKVATKFGKWKDALLAELLAGAQALGLHLGPARLTVAQVQKGLVKVELLRWGHVPLGEGGLEEQGRHLKEIVSQWGAENSPASLAISRELGFCRQVILPRAAKDNLAQVLTYEMDRFLPMGADRLFFDYQVLKETPAELHLLLLAVPRDLVEGWLNLMTNAGLRPLAVDLSPLAAANAFALLSRKLPASFLLLRQGAAGGLELSHFQGGALNFSRPLGLGPISELGDLLQGEIAGLAAAGSKPGALCVLGLDRATPALEAAARQAQLNLVYPADLEVEGLPPEAARQAAALPALGAALQALGKVPFPANLLPPEARAGVKLTGFSLSRVLLATLGILGLVWLASLFIHPRLAIYRIDRELAALAPEVKKVEKQLTESRALAEQLKNLRGRLDQTPGKLLIMRELSRLIPEHTWLYQMRFSQRQVELSGLSRGATGLIPTLEKSGWFTKTEFASPITTDASGNENFKIKAEIKGPGVGS